MRSNGPVCGVGEWHVCGHCGGRASFLVEETGPQEPTTPICPVSPARPKRTMQQGGCEGQRVCILPQTVSTTAAWPRPRPARPKNEWRAPRPKPTPTPRAGPTRTVREGVRVVDAHVGHGLVRGAGAGQLHGWLGRDEGVVEGTPGGREAVGGLVRGVGAGQAVPKGRGAALVPHARVRSC